MTVNITTVKMKPRELASDDNMLLVMLVQGVSTQHRVYMDQEELVYFYRVYPDGGPYEFLKKWATTEQDVTRYESASSLEAWKKVSEVVLAQATKEIEDEMR
jgi:hypothetical protein